MKYYESHLKIDMQGNSLIIQPLPGIGDLVWHLPHIHAIAKQEGPVTLLTKPRSSAKDILKQDPNIRHVLWIKRNPGRHDGINGFFRLSQELKKFSFKRAWVLHKSSRYFWLSRFAGIKQIRFLKEYAADKEPDRHPIARANRLLKAHGVSVNREPVVYVDPQLMALVRQRSSSWGTPWIGVGIGTSEPHKQWGARRFAELILALHKHISSATFFVFGGKQEKALAEQIVNDTHATSHPVVPIIDRPLQEVMALLKQCRFLVSNDTGVLNLSAALQVPVIGLFGAMSLDYSKYIHPVTPEGAAGMAGISVERVLNYVKADQAAFF